MCCGIYLIALWADIDFDDVATSNLQELAKRYPQAKNNRFLGMKAKCGHFAISYFFSVFLWLSWPTLSWCFGSGPVAFSLSSGRLANLSNMSFRLVLCVDFQCHARHPFP